MSEPNRNDDVEAIGSVAGHYRITELLSTGGMGAVYRAEHELIGKIGAVKLLRPELSRDPEMVKRFFNEAKAATAIRHPGIVEVFDFGYHADGRAYLVMEFLDGETLASRLAHRGRLTETEAATIARGIAGALGAAHSKGIVHRDLKPDNIFLVPDEDMPTGERPKVLDFGIAKLADKLPGDSSRTRTGAFMGTPSYMAPEQARGAGEVDRRADLYSLGCMMFEMITGEPPFVADGAGEVIALQLFGEVEPMSSMVAEVSPSLEALVRSLLDKDPDKRPQTAAAVAQALSGSMATLSTRVSAARTAAGGPATRRGPVVMPTPRPARFATPVPGAGPSMALRPTTLRNSAAQSIVAESAPGSRRSMLPMVFAGAVLVAGAAAAVVTLTRGDDAPAKAAEPVAAPETVAAPVAVTPAETVAAKTPEATEVVLTLDVTPAGARLAIDGAAVTAIDGAIRLPRDGKAHQLEVSAEGHVTRSVAVKAERDQTLSFALAPAPAAVVDKIEKIDKKPDRKPDRKPGKKPGAGKKPGDRTGKGSPIEEKL